jgi:hypothetical protein
LVRNADTHMFVSITTRIRSYIHAKRR